MGHLNLKGRWTSIDQNLSSNQLPQPSGTVVVLHSERDTSPWLRTGEIC